MPVRDYNPAFFAHHTFGTAHYVAAELLDPFLPAALRDDVATGVALAALHDVCLLLATYPPDPPASPTAWMLANPFISAHSATAETHTSLVQAHLREPWRLPNEAIRIAFIRACCEYPSLGDRPVEIREADAKRIFFERGKVASLKVLTPVFKCETARVKLAAALSEAAWELRGNSLRFAEPSPTVKDRYGEAG